MKTYNVATELLITFCLSVASYFNVANGFSWIGSRINLKFFDGYSCLYNYDINQLASCYMEYFGLHSVDGFYTVPPQRSVLDLQHIFGFVKNYTGCDLINEPNSKCKGKPMSGRWRPYIDRNGDTSENDEFPDKVPPNPGVKARLKIKSKRNFVKISYDEDEGETYAASPGDDGPDFPLHRTYENSFIVEKRGRINPTYKIEINAGVRRVLLILTGKSKLWFRVHCYACGAWIEVKSNCKESVTKYSGAAGFQESSDDSVLSDESSHSSLKDSSDESADSSASASYHYKSDHSTHKRIHVPLHFENGCTLWKGENTEQSQHRERELKDANNRSKAKLIKSTKTAESSEIMTTTAVALEEPKRKTFIDWILPPGVRKAVKKIPSINHS